MSKKSIYGDLLTAEEREMFDSIKAGTLVDEIKIIEELIKKYPDDPRWNKRLASLLETEKLINPGGNNGNT
ncbi:MAG: hypothetical protein V4446_13610 [Pseudomonadota bacterium]